MDHTIKKRAVHRAKILEGQMKGLTKAIEKEDYCIDLLLQSLSIQKSLKSLDHLLLENHLKTHVKEQMQKKSQEDKAVQELLKIFSLSNK
jgi:DNA-binding FrmR family transcriptional regulator